MLWNNGKFCFWQISEVMKLFCNWWLQLFKTNILLVRTIYQGHISCHVTYSVSGLQLEPLSRWWSSTRLCESMWVPYYTHWGDIRKKKYWSYCILLMQPHSMHFLTKRDIWWCAHNERQNISMLMLMFCCIIYVL